jgi:hypothetical protein
VSGGKLTHLTLVNWRVGKDELVEVFQDRELGGGDAIADRPRLAVCPFCPDQAGDEWIELIAPGHALAGDLVEAGAHPIELQFCHGLQDLMTLHQATFLMLS